MRTTGVLLLTFVAACTSAMDPPSVDTTPSLSAQPSPGPTGADSTTCPVTKPVAAPASIGSALFGSAVAFGNEHLWVGGLGPNGVIEVDERFVSADGSIGWKFGWWRITSGDLKISGHRLDASSAPLTASIPAGYGATGFQATGVTFPAVGCWEVTGTVGSSSLTFVTLVRRGL